MYTNIFLFTLKEKIFKYKTYSSYKAYKSFLMVLQKSELYILFISYSFLQENNSHEATYVMFKILLTQKLHLTYSSQNYNWSLIPLFSRYLRGQRC